MRNLTFAIAILMTFSISALAQPDSAGNLRGEVFYGAGAGIAGGEAQGLMHLGGGFDKTIYKGLGAGAELGYLFPRQSFANGVGLFSANAFYHIQPDSSFLVPFLTGGYSLAFRQETVNLANFGGGVDYWFRGRWGLRMEVRDHVS